MAIRDLLVTTLGAKRVLELDSTTVTATGNETVNDDTVTLLVTSGSFVADPVCEGVANSYQSTTLPLASTNGLVVRSGAGSTNTISGWITSIASTYATGIHGVGVWFSSTVVNDATCIYRQGGTTNNMSFFVGIGSVITFQAAINGQPFLIAQSIDAAQAGRNYFAYGVWYYQSVSGVGESQVRLFVNGKLQDSRNLGGTWAFPPHSAGISIGNTSEQLATYGGGNIGGFAYQKNINYLMVFDNLDLTEANLREIFERMVLPEVTIAADTVANQQIALDALSGNSYIDKNCAIRILQATDATNYRLFVDNITFGENTNLDDISVQFVGTGILTLEETNGTIIYVTSTPTEIEQTSGILTGGGSIVEVANTIRHKTNTTLTESLATKLVFDGTGTTYTVSGGAIAEYENVSGLAVSVTLLDGAPLPTLIETSGTITVSQVKNISITNIIAGSRLQIYNVTTASEWYNAIIAGTSLTTTYDEGVGFTVGDEIRIRLTYQSGTTAYQQYETTVLAGTNGWSAFVSQTVLDVYATIGIDGSLVTEYALDSGSLHADADDADGISQKRRLVAWFYYAVTTEAGIRDFFRAIVIEDAANAYIDPSVVNIKLDNISTRQLLLNDSDFRLYTKDGSDFVLYPSTGGYGITFSSGKVYVGASADPAPTVEEIRIEMDANSTKLTSIYADTQRVDALIEDSGGDRYTAKALELAAGGATAAEVRIEMDSNSTQLAGILTEIDANEAKLDTIISDTSVIKTTITADTSLKLQKISAQLGDLK